MARCIFERTRPSTSSPNNDGTDAVKAKDGSDPHIWLVKSAEFGRSHVYSHEILNALEEALLKVERLRTIEMTEEYLKNAGEVALKRAAFAAHRLAAILREGL